MFHKVPKNAFFGLFFFKSLPAAQKIWQKWGLSGDLQELKKSIEFFLKIRNPPEKILDPPLLTSFESWSNEYVDESGILKSFFNKCTNFEAPIRFEAHFIISSALLTNPNEVV